MPLCPGASGDHPQFPTLPLILPNVFQTSPGVENIQRVGALYGHSDLELTSLSQMSHLDHGDALWLVVWRYLIH